MLNAAVAVERGSGNTDTDRLEYDRIINRKTVQPGEGIAIQQDHQAAAGRLIIAMANYKEATPGAQRGIVPSPRGAAVGSPRRALCAYPWGAPPPRLRAPRA